MTAVAAFDFDGTLTRRDTIVPFLCSVSGCRALARGLPQALPVVALRALGALGATPAKERLFGIYLAGRPLPHVRRLATAFARERLPALLRPAALSRLAWHRSRGHRCLVVTASPDLYIAPWARAQGLELIASRLAVSAGGLLTGAHDGPVCEGREKASRLRAAIGERVGPIYAYGDSAGDREMLALADHAYFRRMPDPGEP